MKKIILVLLSVFSLFMVACNQGGLTISGGSPDSFPEELTQQNNDSNGAGSASSFDGENADTKDGCVYICGAVAKPGIYEFTNGTRLYELIEEAGGLDEEADADAVNLAMEVVDAQQIRIPYIGESVKKDENDLININTADVEELCKIPGIGESRAKAIIEYRESQGGFKEIEDLKNISGIKDATFNKIKPYVCVR